MQGQLNDDCLLHIFNLLNIKDQLNLAEVCEYFRFLIVDYIWSKKYRDIHTQMKELQPLSITEYKRFFQYNAENIRKLHIEDTKHYAFTSYLNRFTNRPDFSFYFSLKMSNLRELYCHDSRLHDGYIEMLTKYCPSLEIFHTESTHVTGAHMDQLKMLREVLTKYIHKLGVSKEWALTDVVGLEPEMLEWIPKPVKAIILLFPCSEKYEKHRAEENERLAAEAQDHPSPRSPKSLFYMRQFTSNACGTVALIHSVANNASDMTLEEEH